MVMFHKYEVRVKPGTSPALTLYAPDWESLVQNGDYRQLIEDNRPYRLQLTDISIWYRNGEDNRNATEEEISAWTQDDEYIHMPQMEIHSPMYYYPSFGDETILVPLREKLQNEYAEYLAEWKTAYGESREAFLSRIGEVCTVKTVYHNLLNCCDCYPQAYMKELAEEERPLRTLARFYDKLGRFDIEPEAADMLEMLEESRNLIGKYYAAEERATHTNDHEQLMAILDENLDRENLANEQSWQTLDFDGTLDKAMEIYTMCQLYHTLRNEKHLYPAEKLDIAAQFAKPMEDEKSGTVGPRDMYSYSLKEIRGILPQMYPDTVPEPDPWEKTIPVFSHSDDEQDEEMSMEMNL